MPLHRHPVLLGGATEQQVEEAGWRELVDKGQLHLLPSLHEREREREREGERDREIERERERERERKRKR